MIRQLIGLALGASMLHLNIERADLACATHAHPVSVSTNAEHAAHSTHAPVTRGHTRHAEHGVTESEKCDAPSQPDCCQALVTCSIALGVEDVASPLTLAAFHDGVLAVGQRTPISRVTAPEPPPPKA